MAEGAIARAKLDCVREIFGFGETVNRRRKKYSEKKGLGESTFKPRGCD